MRLSCIRILHCFHPPVSAATVLCALAVVSGAWATDVSYELITPQVHGSETEDVLSEIQDLREPVGPGPTHVRLAQREAGYPEGEVESALWNVTVDGGDFDATCSTEADTITLNKRGDALFYQNSTWRFRFWADTLEKGHLYLPPSLAVVGAANHSPQWLESNYFPLVGDVYTAPLWHILADLDPQEYLRRAASLESTGVAVIQGETCRGLRMRPCWQWMDPPRSEALGLRPVIECWFSQQDGRLIQVETSVFLSAIRGDHPHLWLSYTSRVVFWSSTEPRQPTQIALAAVDHREGSEGNLTYDLVLSFDGSDGIQLGPVEAASACMDLEPRSAAFYMNALSEYPTDAASQVALASVLGRDDPTRPAAIAYLQALADNPGESTGATLAQAAWTATQSKAPAEAFQLATQALSLPGTPQLVRNELRVAVIDALRRQSERDAAQAAFLELLPPGDDAEAYWLRDLHENSFGGLLELGQRLGISRGELLRFRRLRLQGCRDRWQGAWIARHRRRAYREWVEMREAYLDALLGRSRYDQVDEFVAPGPATGLAPCEASLERVQVLIRKARHAQYLDGEHDAENRIWLKHYVRQLEQQEVDAALLANEQARINALLTHPDPAVRAEEAYEIKESFHGNVRIHPVWGKHNDYFAQAMAETQQALSLATDGWQKTRAARASIALAVTAHEIYAWPPLPVHPQIQEALALRASLFNTDQQATMDAVEALVAATRGQAAQASQLADSLDEYLVSRGDDFDASLWRRTRWLIHEVYEQCGASQAPTDTEEDLLPAGAQDTYEVAGLRQRRYRYAQLASRTFVERALDPATVKRANIELCVDGAVEAYLDIFLNQTALRVAKELVERVEEDAPPFKRALIRFNEMRTLHLAKNTVAAAAKAEKLAEDFKDDPSPEVREICLQALLVAVQMYEHVLEELDRGESCRIRLYGRYGDEFGDRIDESLN